MAPVIIFSILIACSLYLPSASCQETIPHISIHRDGVFPFTTRTRAEESQCAIDNYSSCGNGLPDNFCCAPGLTCLSLASNTTALCCPEGFDCSAIQPIICDIDQQNVTAFPNSQVHTTNLEASLPSCGKSTCCPFGYRCNASLNCEIDTGATSTPAATPVTSSQIWSTTTSPSSMSMTEPTLLATGSVISNTSDSKTEMSAPPSSNKTGIAVGTTFGAFSIVGALSYCWMRWWRRGRTGNSIPMGSWARTWQDIRSPPRYDLSTSRNRRQQGQEQERDWKLEPKTSTSAVKVSEGCQVIELPATPLSFSFWNRDDTTPPLQPKSCYMPYSRPETRVYIEEGSELE
ncbi:hypothetical protein BJ170DRAFT_83622 [Xylariales sp. AK1849]|nr:hypothetical protein BJ170DRAFT_83622 [Xylariales sp. AK1849]